MVGGTLAISTANALLLEASDVKVNTFIRSSSSKRPSSVVACCYKRNYNIPKLEPFSRSQFDRIIQNPPLIQKTKTQLADYCTTLEGDECYSCWKAFSELGDLEKQTSKREIESIINEAEDVKTLIRLVHGITRIYKDASEREKTKVAKSSGNTAVAVTEEKIHDHIPDGIPKSQKEMEEEEAARMPDSPYTRLLRVMGKYPAWYTPLPDHETD